MLFSKVSSLFFQDKLRVITHGAWRDRLSLYERNLKVTLCAGVKAGYGDSLARADSGILRHDTPPGIDPYSWTMGSLSVHIHLVKLGVRPIAVAASVNGGEYDG